MFLQEKWRAGVVLVVIAGCGDSDVYERRNESCDEFPAIFWTSRCDFSGGGEVSYKSMSPSAGRFDSIEFMKVTSVPKSERFRFAQSQNGNNAYRPTEECGELIRHFCNSAPCRIPEWWDLPGKDDRCRWYIDSLPNPVVNVEGTTHLYIVVIDDQSGVCYYWGYHDS